MFGFFWLVLGWKKGQKLGKLSVLNQILTSWEWLLQKSLFSFLDCYQRWLSDLQQAASLAGYCMRDLFPGQVAAVWGQSSTFTHGLAIGHLCTQTLPFLC